MTRDDIITAASKAGFETKRDMIWVDTWEITPTLTRFAALVAALEQREQCRYPDCVDNGPEGKCIRWLTDECSGPKKGQA
jgi:hypothetical protein